MKITGTTRLTALLGSPVSHSISPMMHNEAFRLLGLDYAYLCFDVTEDRLPEAVRGLVSCGIRGFNLTMPNKNAIVPLLDSLSPEARLMGAVNTVVVENRHLTGYNTDGIGFINAALDAGYDMKGMSITLFGAGGAASAICAQAALSGVREIRMFVRKDSRFRSRAEDLIRSIGESTSCSAFLCLHEDKDALRAAVGRSDMIINATSVGMAPFTDHTILPETGLFRPGLIAADVIYNPRETLFLRQAREAGCRVFNGMYMLLYQGAEAFRLWTGKEMPVSAVKEKYFL